MKWIYASLAAFVLAVGTFFILLQYGGRLSGPDRSIIYLLVLVPLAIASSIMLFKYLRSSAAVHGNMGRYKLHLSGPAALFFLVIWAGFSFYRHPPKDSAPFILAILFEPQPDKGQKPSGQARVVFQSRVEHIPVHDGVGTFSGVQMGYPIEITPEINGFARNSSVRTLVSTEPIKIGLTLDPSYFDTKYRLESQFLHIISNYLSCAKDFSQGLNAAVERIINLDSTATDDEIRFSVNYANAYNEVNSVSDSLLYFLKDQSPDLYEQLEDLKDKALEFHKKYFLGKYNDHILAEINNYINTRKKDKPGMQKIRTDVQEFFTQTNTDIDPLQNRINKLSSKLNERS